MMRRFSSHALIVQVAPQLLGQARHGALRHLAGLQPIVVDAHQAAVRRELVDCRQREDHLEQRGELLLPRGRHQEIPEGAEALALIANRRWRRARRRSPPAASLCRPPRWRCARARRDPDRGNSAPLRGNPTSRLRAVNAICMKRSLTCVGSSRATCPSRMRWISASIAFLRFSRSAMRDAGSSSVPWAILPQQLEHRHQARFGAHELPLVEAGQPVDGAFGGRREIVMRLVAARRIVFAQPAAARRRPNRRGIARPRRGTLPRPILAQSVEVVGEARRQFRLRHGAHVRAG